MQQAPRPKPQSFFKQLGGVGGGGRGCGVCGGGFHQDLLSVCGIDHMVK